MRGYLQCGGGGVSEPIKGFPGETLIEEVLADSYEIRRGGSVGSGRTTCHAQGVLGGGSDHEVWENTCGD